MKLISSKHKRWIKHSTKHSVMQFLVETFQQNVLQESLDTMKRSCVKDHYKSRHTHQDFKKNSGYRVTSCLTQTNNKEDSILSRIVLIPFYKNLIEKELEDDLLQCPRKDTDVNERTAELYSKQGNKDVTELAVFDETTQCETRRRHNAKGMSFCTCGIILHESSAEHTKM